MLRIHRHRHRRPLPGLARLAALVLPAAIATQAVAQAALEPPPGTHEIMSLAASGVQIYTCKQGPDQHLAWTFAAPQAELYDASGKLVVKHYAGPGWEAADGSKLTGKVLRQAASTDGIPQLLLQASQAGGPGLLAPVRYVERLDTHGGAAPAQPCTQAGQEGRSPYLARYVFLG